MVKILSNSPKERKYVISESVERDKKDWPKYIQSSEGKKHVENGLLDTVGKGEGGMNWESTADI